jgi:hemoglobin-like flavoprotein
MSLSVEILSETFERAKKENGGPTRLGLRFYERLFEKYPQVRPLFNTPPEEQHKKLMASIGSIVAALKYPDRLMPFLHAMGIRHVAYGTLSAHYPAVGENLIAVLKEHLSAEGQWTEEMENAWKDALSVVSEVMIDAADHPDQYADELKNAGYLPSGFRPDTATPWVMDEKQPDTVAP